MSVAGGQAKVVDTDRLRAFVQIDVGQPFRSLCKHETYLPL